jgi:hypothetical protein
MKRKQTPQKSKPKAHTQHPEAQPERARSGAPGTENSQAPSAGTARDVRNRHDQDGNGEQLPR